MSLKKTKYEVFIAGEWITCKKAEVCVPPTSPKMSKTPWLHYELADGTNGLKRPGTWREKETMNVNPNDPAR